MCLPFRVLEKYSVTYRPPPNLGGHLDKSTHQHSHGNKNAKCSLLKCRTASRACLYPGRPPTEHRRQKYFFLPGVASFVSSSIYHILFAPPYARDILRVWIGAISASTVTPAAKMTSRRVTAMRESAPLLINRWYSLRGFSSYGCGRLRVAVTRSQCPSHYPLDHRFCSSIPMVHPYCGDGIEDSPTYREG